MELTSANSSPLCVCLTKMCVCAQTRLMAQQKQPDGSQRYRGFIHALVTIPREEGLRAMWKGLLPRLMRIPPGQVGCFQRQR